MNERFCAKRPVLTLIFVLCGIFCAKAQILVETESFSAKGGWVVDQQFMDLMGSPYLITKFHNKTPKVFCLTFGVHVKV